MLGWVRCLIVDDNEPFLKEARELLEREGIDVIGVARTASEALAKIAQLQPELTLVDIDLGSESGFDLMRAMADQPSRSTTSVILISVHDESDFADLTQASSAAGFVSKTELSAQAIQDVLASDRTDARWRLRPRSGT
jgi:two-component system nitrate/nitrite response regulator NarL